MPKKILVLAANPENTPRLNLAKEIREIEDELKQSHGRDNFEIRQIGAVRHKDVRRALLDYDPNIVHFAGHGTNEGIVLEDQQGQAYVVPENALSGLFELFSNIECVVLNACYTANQARAIARHVDYVVGVQSSVDDKVAPDFAAAFYNALGSGKDFEYAYKIGCNDLEFTGFSEHTKPVLLKKQDILEQENEQLRQRQTQQEIEKIASIIHTYAQDTTRDILSRLLATAQEIPDYKVKDISGQWRGEVNRRQQEIEIRQRGFGVNLAGIADGNDEMERYMFIGEGQVVHNLLVFYWRIHTTKGINIMTISEDLQTLDGTYFTALGGAGVEKYTRVN